jgi:N6-L-threonylcarbamoyladenine synthase
MADRLFLGIDTSNYKTSVALTDENRETVFQKSGFLEVEQGKRGIRQSDAFFAHSNVLPSYIDEAFRAAKPELIAAVSVSNAPRNIPGSYMPVFNAGLNTARIISATLGVPLYEFSHQEGHVEAIMHSCDADDVDEFDLFHLSGGTTELLRCRRESRRISCEIEGATKDISIGMLLDRLGVALGYPFPAGKYLDAIAYETLFGAEGDHDPHDTVRTLDFIPSKIAFKDGFFNLSGIETQTLKKAAESGNSVVPGVFIRLHELLEEAITYCVSRSGSNRVYLAGGVSSSRTIRRLFESDPRPVFGSPELSGDNAVGISLLGSRAYYTEKK